MELQAKLRDNPSACTHQDCLFYQRDSTIRKLEGKYHRPNATTVQYIDG